jgi:mono/diheme cytochrome c family protein
MEKPWYYIFYIRSPILKIVIGIISVMAAVVAIGLVFVAEEPRMAAQAGNWNGRSVETGAALYANNCASCHGVDGKGGSGPALHSNYFFTQRINDVNFAGTLEDYIKLTVAAGRPSKANTGQWVVMMPTWSSLYGGPFRDDQVVHVTNYVLNWERTALEQTPDEDPWIPYLDTPSKAVDGEGRVVAPVAATDGPREPQVVFQQLGCAGCHNLNEDQTEINRGPIGPHLGNLDQLAPTRVTGEDAVTYVHNSIVHPNDYIVPGYMANIMPGNLSTLMSDEELDALVAWLLQPDR